MNERFQMLKNFDFQNSTAHLWVFKNSTAEIRYRASYVQTEDGLSNQLKGFVIAEINSLIEQAPYSYIAQTNENSCLSIPQDETDFPLLKAQVDRIESEHRAMSVNELKGAKGYLAKFTNNGLTIYAVKRSTTTWKTAYGKKFINMIFSNGELSSVEDNGFSIERNFDFYSVNGAIFISNKRGFESALQHKASYRHAFVQLQDNQAFSSIFTNLEPIIEYVGTNSIHLRRMAIIEEKGIYSLGNFIPRLQEANLQYGWGINFDNQTNQIIPCEQTIRVIIQVLLDHRLMSQITENIYDVPDAIQV